MKASQSFEMLGTACRLKQPYIPEDQICSSTSQNLKYCRKISAYAEITAWAVTVLELCFKMYCGLIYGNVPVLNGGTGKNHKTSVQIGGVPGISQMQVQRFNAMLSYLVSGLKSNSKSGSFI
jgi:hypothetical protein